MCGIVAEHGGSDSQALERMLERDFDTLLFAHGDPLVGGGRQALERFVAG